MFASAVVGGKIVCHKCGVVEKLDTAVLRCVEEYVFLFPERWITTEGIYEWCGGVVSKRSIRRILIRNLILVSFSKYSYYAYP
jgi:hypothetical protein